MRLHAYDLIINNTGEVTATAVDLTKEGATVKVDPKILEVMGSKSSNPTDRIDLGAKLELKAVLLADTLGELGDQLNNEAAAMKVEGTRIKVLDKYDAEFTVVHSDGSTETWKATEMTYDGKLDAAFKGEDKWHLPITLQSTAGSALTVITDVVV